MTSDLDSSVLSRSSPRSLSCFLSLLDLLLENPSHFSSPEPLFRVRLPNATEPDFASIFGSVPQLCGGLFVRSCFEVLRETASLFDIEIISSIEDDVPLVTIRAGEAVLESARESVVALLNRRSLFDFESTCLCWFEKARATLREIGIPYIDCDKLDRLECREITITQELGSQEDEWMAPSQWNFVATSAGWMMWPNANAFGDRQRRFWINVSREEERLYRDYEFRSIFVPFHEMLHCFQGYKWKLGQVHSMAEFEASVAHFELFLACCVENDELGLFYELVLWVWRLLKRIQPRVLPADLAKYVEWRDSWGRVCPFGEDLDVPTFINSYHKLRLPFEAFRGSREFLQDFFQYHFAAPDTTPPYYDGSEIPDGLRQFQDRREIFRSDDDEE